jgi:3-dehydroquinate dehydratase II
MKDTMKILLINGANLNLLGTREPEIYGKTNFDNYFSNLKKQFQHANLEYFQSNIEGEIVNKLHECGFNYDGIIINAGGYSHTSVAIADAISAIKSPVIEVHISNIFAREEYRHKSLLAAKCVGIISGFGLNSYKLAITYFLDKKKEA